MRLHWLCRVAAMLIDSEDWPRNTQVSDKVSDEERAGHPYPARRAGLTNRGPLGLEVGRGLELGRVEMKYYVRLSAFRAIVRKNGLVARRRRCLRAESPACDSLGCGVAKAQVSSIDQIVLTNYYALPEGH
jgi:hypothetical protein